MIFSLSSLLMALVEKKLFHLHDLITENKKPVCEAKCSLCILQFQQSLETLFFVQHVYNIFVQNHPSGGHI